MVPRHNGERAQFVARLNESVADSPAEFKGGVPQALMLMNGRLVADATSLDNSRTLRAIVDAPFLSSQEKMETLFMAALTRKPRSAEIAFLSQQLEGKSTEAEKKQVYAEILWGLLNSPEYILSR